KLSITGLLLFAITSRWIFSPLVVAKPSWSMLTFTVTGTPARTPKSSPRASATSTAAACARTSAGLWSTTALILGLTASSRASAAVAASFAETFFDLISEAISAADRRHRSCMQNSISIAALLERFQANGKPVRVKKTRQIKNPAPGAGQCQRGRRLDFSAYGRRNRRDRRYAPA